MPGPLEEIEAAPVFECLFKVVQFSEEVATDLCDSEPVLFHPDILSFCVSFTLVFFFQVKRTTLVDSRTSVTDVKFAPKHMGLMLATCSADGIVRIYEAPDVMNLSQWSLQHEISCKLSCSCISWNPSR